MKGNHELAAERMEIDFNGKKVYSTPQHNITAASTLLDVLAPTFELAGADVAPQFDKLKAHLLVMTLQKHVVQQSAPSGSRRPSASHAASSGPQRGPRVTQPVNRREAECHYRYECQYLRQTINRNCDARNVINGQYRAREENERRRYEEEHYQQGEVDNRPHYYRCADR